MEKTHWTNHLNFESITSLFFVNGNDR